MERRGYKAKNIENFQKLEEENILPQSPWKERSPANSLISDFSRPVREYMCAVLSHPVCDDSLWQF